MLCENEINEEYNIPENRNEYNIKDNGVLLISEINDKVFLPYKAEEVVKLLNSEKYKDFTPEEIIEKEFIKPFSYYKDLHYSRFKETVILLTKRDSYKITDGITLGLELFGKRYLHPAIISACKSLDELNVYLDCLDKNELEDFKIFEIKYELYPEVINKNSIIYKIKQFRPKLQNASKEKNIN